MKQNLTKFTKALLLCLIIVIASCEKDLYENASEPKSLLPEAPFKTKIVVLNEIPIAKDFINQNFKSINSKSAKTTIGELDGAVFNEKSIIQNIDDNNNTNYSIGFVYYDTPENIFYNLVISVSPSGAKSSHIFKFICNPDDYPNFKAHHFNFKYFKGVTELSSINSLSSSSSKTTSKEAVTGDDACPKILIPSASGSSAGTGTSSGGVPADSEVGGYRAVEGYNVSAGSGNLSVEIGGTTYYAGGGTSTTNAGASTGEPCNCFPYREFSYNFLFQLNSTLSRIAAPSKATTSKTAVDCPPTTVPTGYVPINADPAVLPSLKASLGLSKPQFIWLGANQDKLIDVYNFYDAQKTPEAKAIALSVINANMIVDKIDDSQLDPCPKGVMEQLKNTTNVDIAIVLAKLGASNIYTVNMVMKPADTYAETQRISAYNYEIRVDRDSYTDGTKLFKATALIHEIIHAYFLSIVDDYNYTPSTALPSFSELFEAFGIKEHPISKDKQDAQHLAMANKYVDAMASALQEYDANYMIDYQVYQDLAWGSLRDAPIFEKTFPLGSANNIRITNRYKAESSGHAVDQGTPNQQIPVGKICK